MKNFKFRGLQNCVGNKSALHKMRAKSFWVFAVIGLLLFGCKESGKITTLKLAHGLDPGHPVHKAMEYMADKVAEKSAGTMRIDIYPSEQLGSERECIELLQIGSLGMTKVSASIVESFVPSYRVLGLPYIFRDEAHRFEVLDGEIGQKLLLESEKYLIRGLCFYDAGSRSFYTINKPIRTPDDLQGMKIRTMESATAIKMVNALGGAATPISWGELYTALQQGVVDGAENNPPSFYLSRHYEVCKYYSLDEHTSVPDVLVMSTVVWNSLTAEQQKIVQEAAKESAQYQKQLWKTASEDALRAVQAAGVEVIRPDKQPFVAKVADLLQAYEDQPEMHKLIQEIMQ